MKTTDLLLFGAIGVGVLLLLNQNNNNKNTPILPVDERKYIVDFATNSTLKNVFNRMNNTEVGYVYDYVRNYIQTGSPLGTDNELYYQILTIENKYRINL